MVDIMDIQMTIQLESLLKEINYHLEWGLSGCFYYKDFNLKGINYF